MVAIEGYEKAKKKLDDCLVEKQSCIDEREHLSSEMDSLKSQISILQEHIAETTDAEESCLQLSVLSFKRVLCVFQS